MVNAAKVASETEARLPAELESVVAARRLVTESARKWNVEDDPADDAALIVSELVTNAVLHAETPFVIKVARLGTGMRIEVTDGSSRLPTGSVNDPEQLLENRSMTGRGLSLVAAMADRWGADRRGDGKVVWAEVGTNRRVVNPMTPPAFPPSPAKPELTAPALAAGVREVTALAAGGRQVHLVGVPVRLLVESVRQLTDLQREMQVIGLDQSGPKELVALADSSREIEARIGHLRESGLDVAERAMARGETVVDFDMVVPPDAGAQLDRLGALLSRVRNRLVRRHLLTLPASKEIADYRVWWSNEVTAQLAGRAPTPCPFSPRTGN